MTFSIAFSVSDVFVKFDAVVSVAFDDVYSSIAFASSTGSLGSVVSYSSIVFGGSAQEALNMTGCIDRISVSFMVPLNPSSLITLLSKLKTYFVDSGIRRPVDKVRFKLVTTLTEVILSTVELMTSFVMYSLSPNVKL